MKWDSINAASVRTSGNYYTHDYNDHDNYKLNAIHTWATNFPNPVVDVENDNWWADNFNDEIEVTSVNSYFPSAWSTYSFTTYWQRQICGHGTVYQTPQLSNKQWWESEYNTVDFDRNIGVGYYTYSCRESELTYQNLESKSLTLDIDSEFPIKIHGSVDGSIYIAQTLPSNETELSNYIEWAKTIPVETLKGSGIANALTVITFKEPTNSRTINQILEGNRDITIERAKTIFIDENNLDHLSNNWTIQVGADILNNNFSKATDDLVNDLEVNGMFDATKETNAISLREDGIVSIVAWIPLSRIQALNNVNHILLADTSPSYLRLISAQNEEIRSLVKSREDEVLPDGLPSFLEPVIHDMFAIQSRSETK